MIVLNGIILGIYIFYIYQHFKIITYYGPTYINIKNENMIYIVKVRIGQ